MQAAPAAQDDASVVHPTPVTIATRNAAIAAHLDREFQLQARNDPWAGSVEAEVRTFFTEASHAEGSRLLDADCHSSLCRLRIAHEDKLALERFMAVVGLEEPFTVAGVRFPDPVPERSVMFIARRDTALPWPDVATLPPQELPAQGGVR